MRFAPLLAVVVLLASSGCTSGGSNGDGGSAGDGGSGGEGGSGGDVAAAALDVCQAWCRNEARGPSCCIQDPFSFANCRDDCYDRCEDTVAEVSCVETRVSLFVCQLDRACDDFFNECQALEGRFQGCLRRADADVSGRCATAAAGCGITEAQCLSTYEAGSAQCAFGWDEYVLCAGDGFATCEQCVTFSRPFDEECDWPSGAGEEVEFVPKSCDTLPLPPAGCDGPCPGGSNTECGFGTYCEAEACEADCVTDGDCARADACSVRGRCLPTIFGTRLDCSWFDDPPSGCGASCPGGSTSECPDGTSCISNLCDAQCNADEQCGSGEQCSGNGRCEEIPLPECSDGRLLDETFTSDRESLTCGTVIGFDVIVEAELTAKPTAPLQAGSNTYDVQLALMVGEGAVDLLLGLGLSNVRFVGVAASVLPTMGTTDPSSVEFQNTPLPCDVPIVENTPVEIVMPIGQATWNLDDGTTQELAVDRIDIVINALGLDLPFTTGPDGVCTWDAEVAKVSFSVP